MLKILPETLVRQYFLLLDIREIPFLKECSEINYWRSQNKVVKELFSFLQKVRKLFFIMLIILK